MAAKINGVHDEPQLGKGLADVHVAVAVLTKAMDQAEVRAHADGGQAILCRGRAVLPVQQAQAIE